MTQRCVYLGGEGRNELGGRCGHPLYQSDESPGVIEGLLSAIRPDGWSVAGACQWSAIRKLNASGPTPGEERNVLGLALEAKRSNAQVLAFIRDADDDARRPAAIESAIAKAGAQFPNVEIVGATAIPVLEGWLLAMLGDHRTEQLSKAGAQARLAERDVETTAQMVDIVRGIDLGALPKDARGLRQWIQEAAEALA